MTLETKKDTEPRWIWLAAGCLLILLAAVLMPSPKTGETPNPSPPTKATNTAGWRATTERLAAAYSGKDGSSRTAAEIVAAKLNKFSLKRRALVEALAKKYKITVLPDVERFFDALDAGNWEEAQRLFRSLKESLDSPGSDLPKYWRAVLEAYGAAQQVQLWPPQQLLDYGNGILDSLKPGMVYFGGTDSGCFICTMLNETTGGEQHITLTQNALATPDASYLDYLSAIYGDSLNVPSREQFQNAFDQYTDDATKRALHDQQFPDEPPQLLPGENITLIDGRANLTGAGPVATMAIDNLLTQALLKNNPGLSFALQESGPMQSTYAGSTPLGQIFQLNAGNPMTADAAGQVVNYWQSEAQNLQAAGETSTPVLQSYAHNVTAQGNLLANNNYSAEAGQAYQTALNIWPASVEAVTGLTGALAQQGQFDQAGQALDAFLQNNPDQSQTVGNLRQAWLAHH